MHPVPAELGSEGHRSESLAVVEALEAVLSLGLGRHSNEIDLGLAT